MGAAWFVAALPSSKWFPGVRGGAPYSSQVAGELRELRSDAGRSHYRILYRRSHNIFVILHFLEKRVDRLSQADIEVADSRWADFQARMNAPIRRPPRAAGHDAP